MLSIISSPIASMFPPFIRASRSGMASSSLSSEPALAISERSRWTARSTSASAELLAPLDFGRDDDEDGTFFADDLAPLALVPAAFLDLASSVFFPSLLLLLLGLSLPQPTAEDEAAEEAAVSSPAISPMPPNCSWSMISSSIFSAPFRSMSSTSPTPPADFCSASPARSSCDMASSRDAAGFWAGDDAATGASGGGGSGP
mmetsp:Transcript_16965/g.40237  ORF Transcript_16965/g.40237 Transcript_16965/m.40237 type:complete len:201 (+) Transcript_16965:614-1216(+)